MSQSSPTPGKSLSFIQAEADDYAGSVLRYFSSGDETLPALPSPERETVAVVTMWLHDHFDIDAETASRVAGAALGAAREEMAL